MARDAKRLAELHADAHHVAICLDVQPLRRQKQLPLRAHGLELDLNGRRPRIRSLPAAYCAAVAAVHSMAPRQQRAIALQRDRGTVSSRGVLHITDVAKQSVDMTAMTRCGRRVASAPSRAVAISAQVPVSKVLRSGGSRSRELSKMTRPPLRTTTRRWAQARIQPSSAVRE